MLDNKIKSYFGQANEYMEIARKESFKSEEDVVPYMICSNARRAMTKYLLGYLMQKGHSVSATSTPELLLGKCLEINPNFKNINLKAMNCSDEEKGVNFCTDLKKVVNCFHIAEDIKDMMVSETWPLSKPVK
jgi:hypothetical protein